MGENMDKYLLDDEVYYYKNGRWVDSDNMSVPTSLVSRLNRLLTNSENLSEKSVVELIELFDKAKKADNTQLALKAVEAAIEKADVAEIKSLLPRATSIYRNLGKSQKAIDMMEHYIEIYDKSIISQALLTSVAAAYCDIGKLDMARKYANKAKASYAGQSSPELINVYARLKSLE